MVDEIYYDFATVVSKERKIEISDIINNIGALIYSSKKAVKLYLIDGEISLDNLINKTIKENNFKDYKVIKRFNKNNSLLRKIISNNFYKTDMNINFACISLRTSISSVLSYESTGC